MTDVRIEVLMVGSTKRNWELRHHLLLAELHEKGGDWQLVSNYRQTYPHAIDNIPAMKRLDLVFIYNDLWLPQNEFTKFCKQLAEVLAAHPNKPVVGFDAMVMAFMPKEEEKKLGQIFEKKEVELLRNDLDNVLRAVMDSKASRALN